MDLGKTERNLPNRKSSACRFRSLRRKNTPRTPHRRHWRVRYALHRSGKISVSRRVFYQCFGRYLIYFYTYWAMRWNYFALANAVLRAVPCGHSRKSFHRRAIATRFPSRSALFKQVWHCSRLIGQVVNGATVSAIRHLSLSHGKKFAFLILNKIGVLYFCPQLILSLHKICCISAKQLKQAWLFCSRFALSLQLKFCKELLKNIRCSYTLYKKFVTLQTWRVH